MEIYHVLSRGVDKRKIFIDDKDRFRFIHNLYEFNDEAPADNSSYHYFKGNSIVTARRYDVSGAKIDRQPRKLLVNILSFCLMPNHYHLLLQSVAKNGVSRFMKKLNMGYSRYFNIKHERTGTLFEGRFKSVPIENEAHFIYIPYYIHLNPLDIIAPEWRQRKIYNLKKVHDYLNSYRWSSHLDYCGRKNFPSVTQRKFLLDVFEGETCYEKAVSDWLRHLDIAEIKNFVLE